MNLGIYSYLATILMFCGLAFFLYLGVKVLQPKATALSATDWKVISWTILIMTLVTGPEEKVALAWRAWLYNPERTFNMTIGGAEIETYLFSMLVTLVVSIATIVSSRRDNQPPYTSI